MHTIKGKDILFKKNVIGILERRYLTVRTYLDELFYITRGVLSIHVLTNLPGVGFCIS